MHNIRGAASSRAIRWPLRLIAAAVAIAIVVGLLLEFDSSPTAAAYTPRPSSAVLPRPSSTAVSRDLARPPLSVPWPALTASHPVQGATPAVHTAGPSRAAVSPAFTLRPAPATVQSPSSPRPVLDPPAAASSTSAAPVSAPVPTPAQWARLRFCESGGNYANKANPGHRGGYQIGFSEWNNFGGFHDPADASPALQDQRALQIWQARGWEPWYPSEHCTGLTTHPTPTGAQP